MIKFLNREVIGKDVHRSGWPWCMDALSDLGPNGILFDDFVERTFVYEKCYSPHIEPWIGVFHHPPFIPNDILQIPKYSMSNLTVIGGIKPWIESKKHLTKAITFSTEAAVFLNRWLDVPSFAVTHPTEIPESLWSSSSYMSNNNKKVVQIGMQLRNLRGIYQLPPVTGISKARFKPYSHNIDRDNSLIEFWSNKRVDFGGVEELDRISNSEYDDLLASNIVFLELFGACANNVVVECIARSTPLLINRLPATIEYLGYDYPLFYKDLYHASDLLNSEAIYEAHDYLREMDKSALSGETFIGRIVDIIES